MKLDFGYPILSQYLSNLKSNSVITLFSYSDMGQTDFALNIVANLVKNNDCDVLYLSNISYSDELICKLNLSSDLANYSFKLTIKHIKSVDDAFILIRDFPDTNRKKIVFLDRFISLNEEIVKLCSKKNILLFIVADVNHNYLYNGSNVMLHELDSSLSSISNCVMSIFKENYFEENLEEDFVYIDVLKLENHELGIIKYKYNYEKNHFKEEGIEELKLNDDDIPF